MTKINFPEILNIPKKMRPLIISFDDYNYFLIEGGRASGKTQSAARFLLYLSDIRKLRICCGRETMKSIEESVKTVFIDLIEKYHLNYIIKKESLINKFTNSKLFFKGFRELGRVNIKGLEGIDILWIDEAQAITKPTLDTIIPTIRKKNSKIIFTMNRFSRFDSVYEFCAKREDCLKINICYFDNNFVDEKILNEAKISKERNINDYNHIWLGHPLENNSDYLVSSIILDKAYNLKIEDTDFKGNSVMSVDLSASGADLSVAKLFVQETETVWQEKFTQSWHEDDTDITKGKIINLFSEWSPDILIMDTDGLGYPIWVSVKKVLDKTLAFKGAKKPMAKYALNARADGYLALRDYLEKGYLKLNDKNTIRQLEYLKKVYKPNGLIAIQDKKEIRKCHNESPDFADCAMMALYAINYCMRNVVEGYFENNVIENEFEVFE